MSTESGPSLRIVPGAASASSTSLAATSHPVHLGVHDAMRHGPRSLAHEHSAASSHPVQARLEGWQATREQLKQTMLRNTYGLGAPMRASLEQSCIVKVSPGRAGGDQEGLSGSEGDDRAAMMERA